MLVINVSNLVRKSDYKTKINEIENKITANRIMMNILVLKKLIS